MELEQFLLRHGIGYDALMRYPTIFQNATNHPPHSIRKTSGDNYVLELAVAGFSKDEIDISTQDGILTITGSKNSLYDSKAYVYSGIAFRDFSRQFKLGEFVEVTSANLENGLLIIELTQIIPEAKKPKKISIK